MSKDRIESLEDLCNYFYADEPDMLNKRVYEGTDCGASISVYLRKSGTGPWGGHTEHVAIHNGMNEEWRNLSIDTPIHSFTIQTIVEGSDATVDSEPFVLPVDSQDVAQWMDFMEGEAKCLWDEANLESCECCGEPIEGEELDGPEELGLCATCHGNYRADH